MFSCHNTEKKIAHSFNTQPFIREKIQSEQIQIYDTIYLVDVEAIISDIENMLKNMPRSSSRGNYRDSIVRNTPNRQTVDSLIRREIDRANRFERDFSRLQRQRNNFYQLQFVNSEIVGFKIRIMFETDTLNFVIKADDFNIMGPAFVFEYKNNQQNGTQEK